MLKCLWTVRGTSKSSHFLPLIRRIEVEYTREEDDKREATLADITFEIHVNLLYLDEVAPTPASWPICTFAPYSPSQDQGIFTSGYKIQITQGLILKVRCLDKLTDIRASKLVKATLEMIQRAIVVALTPVQASLHA